jgi:arylsulfatase A-like enzyme
MIQNRRHFLKSAALGVGAVCLSYVPACSRVKKKPNILFLFSDDHAVQAISAYGSKINTTPHIDRIAGDGTILKRNTCCNSICAPSRAAILTGKHSHANGKRTNLDTFDPEQQSFPKLLQGAGYQTALIGKWHLKAEPSGFDYWDILPGQGHYYNPDFISAAGKRQVEGYNSDIITDLALEWLKENSSSTEPFMLMCQYKAPHRTWAPGPDHLTMYDDEDIPEPETLFDDYANRSDFLKDNEMSISGHLMDEYDLKLAGSKEEDVLGRAFKNPEFARMTPEQRQKWDAAYEPKNAEFRKNPPTGKDRVRWNYQRYIKDYLRCIASVDDNIGRLLDYLDDSGLADNSLVIYSSDQGFYLGEHGWYDKRWMYEESLAMPFVARWPGRIPAGTSISKLTQNIDFAPTFLDAAGVQTPADMHGASLLPLLSGEEPDWRKSIYYHYYEEGEHNVPAHEGVRGERFKLIHFYTRNTWEFYDLENDPQELVNQYKNPEYAKQVKQLYAELLRLKKLYNAPDVKSN